MTAAKTPMPPETNLQREFREQGEAQERRRSELLKDPQQAAMAKATELTKVEREDLEAAEARLHEAEAGLASALNALNRARRGMAPVRAPDTSRIGMFLKRPDTYRAAAASLPDLQSDVEEARAMLNSATKRRNALVLAISRARNERRRQAKAKHAPARSPVKSRGDKWMAAAFGKDAA